MKYKIFYVSFFLGLVFWGIEGSIGQNLSQPSIVTLPKPKYDSSFSIEKALLNRRSIRDFIAEPLLLEDLSQLLWVAQGVTSPQGFRTTPSAGAIYPLELYLATAKGFFKYLPESHQLEQTKEKDIRQDIWFNSLRQKPLAEAPAIFIICGNVRKTAKKYRSDAARYVDMEAGHAAQNILLQTTALNLGAVVVGAFDEKSLKRSIGVAKEFEILTIVAVGRQQTL